MLPPATGWPKRAWILYERPDGQWIGAVRGIDPKPGLCTAIGSYQLVMRAVIGARHGLPIIVRRCTKCESSRNGR